MVETTDPDPRPAASGEEPSAREAVSRGDTGSPESRSGGAWGLPEAPGGPAAGAADLTASADEGAAGARRTETEAANPEGAAPAEERWQVRLAAFEGPLDLLLHLVRKAEVDIRDIPIATIARQYQDYLEVMRELNLNLAGEFVLLASTLVYLKSRSLIPRELLPEDRAAGGEGESPEEAFFRELEEYQRFREAARRLAEKQLEQETLWPRGVPAATPEEDGPYLEVTLFDLIEAFRELQQRLGVEEEGMRIRARRPTVLEKVLIIAGRLHGRRSMDFFDLLLPAGEGPATRGELIATFLALLELMRKGLVRVLQREGFGPLRVFKSVTDEEFEKRCHEGLAEESAG